MQPNAAGASVDLTLAAQSNRSGGMQPMVWQGYMPEPAIAA